MMIAECRVETASASKYIAQLCKHFAHKITVEYDATTGRADFPWGVCRMNAGDAALTLHCEAQDAEGLNRIKAVIEDHLGRFAWREKPALTWTDAS